MLPKIKVSLSRRNASKREKVVTGFVVMTAMVFLWIEGTSGELEPNLTSVESWGETQIKVTWQLFDHVESDKPHFYELYIDDYLEYFGNDVIYIARRLTPDTMYHFKLRSCIQDSDICSPFSKTLSGTTDQSRKRGVTKSFIQWTILCLIMTAFACTTALVGAKISRRLWRSFLYRYDYRSETNLQVPKYVASTDTADEDLMSSLCLKTLPHMNERNLAADLEATTCEFNIERCKDVEEGTESRSTLEEENIEKESPSKMDDKTLPKNQKIFEASNEVDPRITEKLGSKYVTKGPANLKNSEVFTFSNEHKKCAKIQKISDIASNRNGIPIFDEIGNDCGNNERKKLFEEQSKEYESSLETVELRCCLLGDNERKCLRKVKGEDSQGRSCKVSTTNSQLKENLQGTRMNCALLNTHKNDDSKGKISEGRESSKLVCKGESEWESFTIKRAHSIPKITRKLNSKGKSNGHRRACSFDSNIQNKIQHETVMKTQNRMNAKHGGMQHNQRHGLGHSPGVVIVVDNSNIFIGAKECASLLNPHERKRNIRVKIQQLVKVFQRGRSVSCAFVQGSSPPTTEQVWEVYRHLGYCVDVEDRRGKDEQRVDEGLHLHIYKALCEVSPQTLVIASGDGNKAKSEGATSLPACAQTAIERGWQVEIHSWKHSTSMEWLKLSKKYPEQLTIHYLDWYLKHVTFVDGKHGRKCQPFPTDFFKRSTEYLN